jgi:hypothetical protein
VQALVLGAFGCGAFKNPPELVSGIFKNILKNEGYKEHFSKIVFAVKRSNELYCDNLAQFERTFYTAATHLRMPFGNRLTGVLLSEYAQYTKKNVLSLNATIVSEEK